MLLIDDFVHFFYNILSLQKMALSIFYKPPLATERLQQGLPRASSSPNWIRNILVTLVPPLHSSTPTHGFLYLSLSILLKYIIWTGSYRFAYRTSDFKEDDLSESMPGQ